MLVFIRLLIALCVCLAVPGAARADPGAALLRIFLSDGTSFVSYGEFARVGDQVIFSMPAGGTPEDPRLHPVTLAAGLVDWPRTDRYAASARYQQYVSTRAERDYQQLTAEVAALLNDIALSTDRPRALALADEARRTLADWPRTHYGYRQDDVRDIVGLLDGAIARLRGAPPHTFELSLVATFDPVEVEPLLGMPSASEQLVQILRLLDLTTSARDRTALLQSALALIAERGAAMDARATASIRRSLDAQLRDEIATDARYARWTEQTLADARRAAADARVADVRRVLADIPKEDAQLGRRRPEVVQALAGSVQGQLDAARHLRLLRDQWSLRQPRVREYERAVASDVRQLVETEPLLEAIRTLDGPSPEHLASLRIRLSGGAVRLERLRVPEYLTSTHALLVGAWRFAERAVNARYLAVSSADLGSAWEASSAAAAALMMLSRAQQDIRALFEPPTLP